MTPSEFDQAVKKTRLKERARTAARLVLVEGRSYAEAGREVGLTRQAAEQAVKAIHVALKRATGYPDDWVVRTVVVPPEVDSQICAIADAAKKTLQHPR